VEQTGATGYVVHLSCAPALRAAVEAKVRGVNLHIGIGAASFSVDKSYAERAGVEGMKHINVAAFCATSAICPCCGMR